MTNEDDDKVPDTLPEKTVNVTDEALDAIKRLASHDKRQTMKGLAPDDPAVREIDPVTGMQRDYVILSAEERAKGFVRPVYESYVHVGPVGPKHALRDLTPEELERYGGPPNNYIKYEEYPPGGTTLGRYWTAADLARVGAGCGAVTKMSLPIAETYARTPGFYSGTFCVACRAHFPVGLDGEFVWERDRDKRVGT